MRSPTRRSCFVLALTVLLLMCSAPPTHASVPEKQKAAILAPDGLGLSNSLFFPAIRGVTIGPIENQLHPGRGYGSPACARMMGEVKRMGGNWVSITPFGRIWDIHSSGISMTFEVPFAQNRKAVAEAIHQAHAAGLRVLLVPHLWVESGEWRGFIDPGSLVNWTRWAKSYEDFLLSWGKVAQESGADMLAVGVELRRWLTTDRAPLFLPILKHVRAQYTGPLTYAANWDDVEDTVIWGDLDVIGINAFYPLATRTGASFAEMLQASRTIAMGVGKLANRWHKPVVFAEFGYTTRKDPALRPWEWPEALTNVVIDEAAQAQAYRALLAAFIDQPWFAGLFAWRLYADPDDVSQEPEFGFSFRGKLAELELRDAFATHWAADGPQRIGAGLTSFAHTRVMDY